MDSAAVLLGIRRKLTPDFLRLFFRIIPIFLNVARIHFIAIKTYSKRYFFLAM